jgi:hypothetical protein
MAACTANRACPTVQSDRIEVTSRTHDSTVALCRLRRIFWSAGAMFTRSV